MKLKLNKYSTKFIILFLINFLILILIINYIFYPAYISYASVCLPEKKEEIEEKYVIAGTTTSTYNQTSKERDIKIKILEPQQYIIKHELCHYNQLITNFPSNRCDKPLQKYFSEVECYTTQNLPDFVFNILYEYDLKDYDNNFTNK